MYTNVWEGYILIGILKKKKTEKGPWSLSLHHFNCYTILAGLIINEGRISMIMMYTTLSLEDKQGAVSLRFSKAIEDVVVAIGGCCVLSFLGCCCSSSARVLRVSLLKKKEKRLGEEAVLRFSSDASQRRTTTTITGVKKKAQRATFISSFEAHPKTLASS
jgi:hypothetical protein